MNIVIDTSVLVGEMLRKQGLRLLLAPELEFYQPQYALGEANYEIERRVKWMLDTGKMQPEQGQEFLENTLPLILARIQYLPAHAYAPYEPQARRRIPRDPNDWAFVAAALYLGGAGILTKDGDFLGCGLPTWTPETLRGEVGL